VTAGQYELILFGKRSLDADRCRQIAELHRELLPHSPVVLMGDAFMTRFYYPCLSGDGSTCGALALVDDRPAGFIVATTDPENFMPKAIRRHWFRLAVGLGGSVSRRPSRIRAMVEAVSIQRNVRRESYEAGMAEILSFGVRPEFRATPFIRDRGIRLSQDLVAVALKSLSAQGARRARAVVDQDNLPARLFYSGMGWQVGNQSVKGWNVPTMEFVIDLDGPQFGEESQGSQEA